MTVMPICLLSITRPCIALNRDRGSYSQRCGEMRKENQLRKGELIWSDNGGENGWQADSLA